MNFLNTTFLYQKSKRLSIFLVLMGLWLQGCQSAPEGFFLNEQKSSLEDIRSAINNTTGNKFKFVRKDGREFISQYFSKKSQDENFNPLTAKERLYAHFVIWGDRRPYDIQIRVFLERKTSTGYELYGEDLGREKGIGDTIQEHLRSLVKRNAIDDFRPF
jgi:hypothetical protein